MSQLVCDAAQYTQDLCVDIWVTDVIHNTNSYGPSKILASSIFEPPLCFDARYLGPLCTYLI